MGKKLSICLAAIAAVGCSQQSQTAAQPQATPPPPNPGYPVFEPIPPEGKWLSKGLSGGDMQNAVKDFKRIYAAIVAYREKHKKLPTAAELLDTSKPLVEGFQLTDDDFKNPDIVYSDRYLPESRNKSHYGVRIGWGQKRSARPDGTPIPAFPKPGEKDLWLGCDIYVRTKKFVSHDMKYESWTRGHRLVLWSDGTVEAIPEQDLVLVEMGPGHFRVQYPGQTGLPAKTTTVTEYNGTSRSSKHHYAPEKRMTF